MSKRIPVFVYKSEDTVGSGIHEAIACFITTGVHVPFSYHSHQGDEDLEEVGEPSKCDGSCRHYHGTLENFAEKRSDCQHSVERIIEKATIFFLHQKNK